MAQRPLIIALTAAAALAVPALSTPASATCWITCQPPIIKPIPTPVSTAELQANGESSEAVDASLPPYACADESAAIDIGLDCPPEYAWVCCSPPGGPVCCSPPWGGPLICSGGGGPSPVPSSVDAAVVVDSQTEACLAGVSEPAGQDEILECRPEDGPTYVASVLVRLLTLLT